MPSKTEKTLRKTLDAIAQAQADADSADSALAQARAVLATVEDSAAAAAALTVERDAQARAIAARNRANRLLTEAKAQAAALLDEKHTTANTRAADAEADAAELERQARIIAESARSAHRLKGAFWEARSLARRLSADIAAPDADVLAIANAALALTVDGEAPELPAYAGVPQSARPGSPSPMAVITS